MTLPSTISSNLHSDNKNSIHGPFAGDLFTEHVPSVSSSLPFGATDARGRGQSFLAGSNGPLVRVTFAVKKTGSPTDQIFAELYSSTGAAGSRVPDQLLATSGVIDGAGLDSTTPLPVVFGFPTPYTLVSGTHYVIVVKRTGSFSGTNLYGAGQASTSYSDGNESVDNSGTFNAESSVDLYFQAIQSTTNRYAFVIDKTNNKLRAIKSSDAGDTWAEVDSSNAPSITSTANNKSTSAQLVKDVVFLTCPTTTTVGNIQKFQMASDTWGTPITGPGTTLNTNVAGVAPIHARVRPDGNTIVLVYQGATETVMGSARRRVKGNFYNGSTWSGEADIVGATAFSDTTLPATAVHYDLRSVLVGQSGVVYIFYTNSADSNLSCRIVRFSADSPTTATWANLIVPASITTSNSTAYPVGIGTSFRDGGFLKVALPVYDGTVIKVIRVTESLAETAGNWTSTTASSATPEVANCNLGVLIPDLLTEGRLYLFYSKSDRKIYYVHDSGTDTWVAEQQLRPGATVTCGALSGANVDNAIAIQYLDEALTPDGSRFDRL